MLRPSVEPKVIFGSPSTGANSDSQRRAFGKYNEHTHNFCESDDLLYYPLSIGSLVKEDLDRPLFPSGTTVTEHSSKSIVLSNPAIRSSSIATLDIGGVVIKDLVVTQGLSSITQQKRAGFITPSTARSAASITLSGYASSNLGDSIPIYISPRYSVAVSRLSYRVSKGSGVVTLDVGDTSIYSLDMTLDGDSRYQDFLISPTQNPVLEAGEDIFLSFSAVTEPCLVYYTLYLVSREEGV